METIWSAAAPARVLVGGIAARRDPPSSARDDVDAADAAATANDGGERDDVVGAFLPPRARVGRIDAWRDQGFASARDMRDALKTDLGRHNARRRAKGKAAVTEEEFQRALEGGGDDADDVSSISGSDDDDDSDDDDEEHDDDGDGDGGTGRRFTAIRGAAEGAQVVCDPGAEASTPPYAVWRALLAPDERGTRAAAAEASAAFDAAAALRTLRDLRGVGVEDATNHDPNPNQAKKPKPWAVILSRGGHFAASIFDPTKFVAPKGSGGAGGAGGARNAAIIREHERESAFLRAVPPPSATIHKTFHRYVVVRRVLHWFPYDRVRVVNADPEGLFFPASLSAQGPSLSIPAVDAFRLHPTPFNYTPTARESRRAAVDEGRGRREDDQERGELDPTRERARAQSGDRRDADGVARRARRVRVDFRRRVARGRADAV